jgi:hypothetical protein
MGCAATQSTDNSLVSLGSLRYTVSPVYMKWRGSASACLHRPADGRGLVLAG